MDFLKSIKGGPFGSAGGRLPEGGGGGGGGGREKSERFWANAVFNFPTQFRGSFFSKISIFWLFSLFLGQLNFHKSEF